MISAENYWAFLWNVVETEDCDVIEKLTHAELHESSGKVVKWEWLDRWLDSNFVPVDRISLIFCAMFMIMFHLHLLSLTFQINNRDTLFLLQTLHSAINFWRCFYSVNVIFLCRLLRTSQKFFCLLPTDRLGTLWNIRVRLPYCLVHLFLLHNVYYLI